MKKQREKTFLERTAETFDLPGEVAAGQSRVTVTGERSALVEGHRGILEYGDDCIAVRLKKRILTIRGSGIELAAMSQQDLLVTGCICELAFED